MKTFVVLALLATSALAQQPLRNAASTTVGFNAEPSGRVTLHSADFTADGKQDVLVYGSSAVEVRPGNGDGTFRTAISTNVGALALHLLLVADVDRDTRPDLVLGHKTANSFAIMRGQGDGTFGAPADRPTAGRVVSALFDRFNGDAWPDLIVVHSRSSFQHALVLYAGTASGALDPGVEMNITSSGPLAAAGDFNGDGRLDLALGDSYGVSLQLQGADGSFWNTASASSIRAAGMAVADVNADGLADLVLAHGPDRAPMIAWGSVSLSNTVPAASQRLEVTGATDVTAAHMNDDAHLDLVVVSSTGTIAVIPGGAGGPLRPRAFLAPPEAQFLTVADFNGDAKADVVTGLGLPVGTALRSFSFIAGNGDGALRFDPAADVQAAVLDPFGQPQTPIVADYNRDGLPDLTTATGKNIAVLLARASGGYAAPVQTTVSALTASAWMLETGDLDADLIPDLLIGDGGPGGTRSLHVLHGNPDGSFRTGASFPSFFVRKIADFTGDGRTDLFDSSARIHPGNGNGTFGAPIATAISTQAGTYLVADVNHDGQADVVAAIGSTTYTYLGRGAGTFAAPIVAVTTHYNISEIADLNGDGRLDLIGLHTYILLYFGRGDGTFAPAVTVAGPLSSASGGAIADIDGDRHLDIVAGTAIWFNAGDGTFDFYTRREHGAGECATARVVDANGNGKPDVYVRCGFASVVAALITDAGSFGTLTPIVTLAAQRTPAGYSGPLTITASVEPPADGRLTGGVRFYLGNSSTTRIIAVDTGGKAVTSYAVPLGATEIRAEYAGDAHFGIGIAPPLRQPPADTASKIFVTFIDPSPERGMPVGLTVDTRPASGSYLTWPGGTVTIRHNGTVLRTVNAYEVVTNLGVFPPGAHTLDFAYSGDESYRPSTTSATFTVRRTRPVLTIRTSPSQVVAGQTAMLTGQLSAADATGTVTFSVGSRVLGTAAVANGSASLTTSIPDWGFYRLDARYSGDANHEPIDNSFDLAVYRGAFEGTPEIHATAVYSGGVWSVELRVSPLIGARAYGIYGPSGLLFFLSSSNSFRETVNLAPGQAQAFAVNAWHTDGRMSPTSAFDIATAVGFTNDPLVAGATIKLVHLTELQTAVNAVRRAARLTETAFASPAAGSPVRQSHWVALRNALAEARSQLGLSTAFTDPTPTIIRAVHVQELRDAVK